MIWTTKTKGDYPLEAAIRVIGEDLLIAVYGGTRPHIGAVGIAHPRPGLNAPETISATSSVYTVTGHKEDTVVKMMTEKIASSLNRMVVLTAGIHWDNLTPEAIKEVMAVCETLTETIINEAREKNW